MSDGSNYLDPNRPDAVRLSVSDARALGEAALGRIGYGGDDARLAERPHAVWIYRQLAPASVYLERYDDARDAIERLRVEYPGLTIQKVMDALVYTGEVRHRIAGGLRLAGLSPE